MKTNDSWAVLAMQTFLYNRAQITIQKDFQWVLGRWKHSPWPPLPSCPAANAPMETNSLISSAGSKPDQWRIWGTVFPLHPNPPPPVKPSDLTNSPAILEWAGQLIPLQRMDGIKDSKTSLLKSPHLEKIFKQSCAWWSEIELAASVAQASQIHSEAGWLIRIQGEWTEQQYIIVNCDHSSMEFPTVPGVHRGALTVPQSVINLLYICS